MSYHYARHNIMVENNVFIAAKRGDNGSCKIITLIHNYNFVLQKLFIIFVRHRELKIRVMPYLQTFFRVGYFFKFNF